VIERAAILIALAVAGCGHVSPRPPDPVGTSCAEGCRHQAVDLRCDTSEEMCNRLCSPAAPNNPGYPTCLANATTCAEARLCQ
jgi:hypothetical protein